jgi:DNA-directed RNA polymerase beta' subunit
MLKKFPYISGICLDEPVHHVFYKKQSSKVAECFCQECKRRFFEYSGRELNKKTVYEKFKDSEVAAELKKDTAYRKGERSDIYQQFLQDGIVANCVERYSLLLKRIKPDAVLIVANYIKRGKWENRLTNKLADAGVDILLPEFGAGYSILPIPWNHNIQYFEFFSLKDGNSTKPLWGDAVKVKLFDGSNVEAWVTDGNYNYPGIVKANDGKTCYISFDPISIDWESGKKIIQNVLNKFGK